MHSKQKGVSCCYWCQRDPGRCDNLALNLLIGAFLDPFILPLMRSSEHLLHTRLEQALDIQMAPNSPPEPLFLRLEQTNQTARLKLTSSGLRGWDGRLSWSSEPSCLFLAQEDTTAQKDLSVLPPGPSSVPLCRFEKTLYIILM